MLPKKTEGEVVLVCNLCGHSGKGEKLEEYRVVKGTERGRSIPIIEEKTSPALPTTQARCPSCGHNLAQWWMRQTRSADEPSTRFYRCMKCGKVWREYS